MTDPDRAALREALVNLSRYHAWAKGGPVEWAGPVPSTPPPAGQLWVWVSSLLDALDRAKTDLKAYTRLHCQPEIADHCPRCGGRSLFIARSGWLTCANLTCKCPGVSTAVEALRERAEKAEAELEQAFREGYQAGASRHGYEPDAVAAWRERRAAERGGK